MGLNWLRQNGFCTLHCTPIILSAFSYACVDYWETWKRNSSRWDPLLHFNCYGHPINSFFFFFFFFVMGTSIVFKPGLVAGLIQGLDSGFWLDHRAARVNFIFLKKSKWHRFSKKNKSQQVFNRVLSVQPGYPGF
jgi:hypothetical protein